MQLSFAIII